MNKFALLLSLCICLAYHPGAEAADFDGTQPFICSLNQVVVCDRAGEVEKTTAEGINLPQFFFIDVSKKQVTAKEPSGELRRSPINSVRNEHGMLILEGIQLGKPWHAVINEKTGRATITSTTENTAFTVFGACTLSQPIVAAGE